MTLKVWVHVDTGDGSDPLRVCWYMGTSDLMIENAIRMLLHLPRHARFLLRDADGDLVPVASTLPHDHTFQLVVLDSGASPSLASPHAYRAVSSTGQQPHQPRARLKRRRVAPRGVDAVMDDVVSTSDAAEGHDLQGVASDTTHHHHRSIATPSSSPPHGGSMVHLVTRFLETFTCAISNDDNVNFIPSTGPYALYALYCHLFQDPCYHPKSQNGFYKMTSMQGKIDRQRVIRYYQCYANRGPRDHADHRTGRNREGTTTGVDAADQRLAFVTYKPEGKGPLLRKYVTIGTDGSADDLARAATFVQVLDLDPQTVVAQYARFLEGFVPISKTAYQAQTKAPVSDVS